MKIPLFLLFALIAGDLMIGNASWAAPTVAELKSLEARRMLPARCFAGSRTDKQAPGGFATSENQPKKLDAKTTAADGKITLLALPGEKVRLGDGYQGFRLLLVNRTAAEAAFPATDSQLAIIQEALDAQGTWRPIEYVQQVWCGNSYHRVFLPKNHYWEFTSPVLSGPMKTKLRFALQGKTTVYSNEFEGSIHPEQFTNPSVPGR